MKDYNNIKSFLVLYITIIILISITKQSKIIDKNKEEQLYLNINEKYIEKRKDYFRMLNFISDSKKICNRGSKDLKNYFQTGDINYVKLYNFEAKSTPSKYIIDLIEAFDGKNDDKKEGLIENYIYHHLKIVINLIN